MASKQVTVHKHYSVMEAAMVAFCLVLGLSTSARPLYAYADPGTGLMAIQIFGATFAGFLFLIRKRLFDLIARIRNVARRRRD
jgi:hypothetical protein